MLGIYVHLAILQLKIDFKKIYFKYINFECCESNQTHTRTYTMQFKLKAIQFTYKLCLFLTDL